MAEILKQFRDARGDVKQFIEVANLLVEMSDTMKPTMDGLLEEIKKLNENHSDVEKGIDALNQLNKAITNMSSKKR